MTVNYQKGDIGFSPSRFFMSSPHTKIAMFFREVDSLCHVMVTSLQNVVLERNEIHEKYIRAAQERDEYLAQQVIN